MAHFTHSHALAMLLVSLAAAALSRGQEVQRWTERQNLGFNGPLRSVGTIVARPNSDPRSSARHKLFLDGHPDWAVFDLAGRRIEFASASNRESVIAVSKCSFEPSGSKVCTDTAGQQHESREQRTILPDGSREVTELQDSKVVSRQVTQFDEKGRSVGLKSYDAKGKLSSEESTLPNGDYEWKIYDGSGIVVSDERTRDSDDQNRIERWFYDSEGQLVWHLAISRDGDLLSYLYNIGFKAKLSSSDSLGICPPRLCVDYKFDEMGSGRLERTVQHTQGKGNLEPNSEEHYNLDGILDEKAEIKYTRDEHGNWTSRSVSVWDSSSNIMIEIERDTRTIEYY